MVFFADLLRKVLDLKQKWLAKMTDSACKFLCFGQYVRNLPALWLCTWLIARAYALRLVLWVQTGHYGYNWFGTSQQCLVSIAFRFTRLWSPSNILQSSLSASWLHPHPTPFSCRHFPDIGLFIVPCILVLGCLLWKRNVESKKKLKTWVWIH